MTFNFPRVGERVHLTDRSGEYIVLQCDHEKLTVDLLRLGDIHEVEEAVSLARLRRPARAPAPPAATVK